MKKAISILCAALLLACVFAGCNGANSRGEGGAPPEQREESAGANSGDADDSQPQPDTAPENAKSGKTLVVYYSASGNTKAVAEVIAETEDADLFELVPQEIYTGDDLNWRDSGSRVSREHEDESLRDVALVAATVEGWDDYDTVYIGYPIWWGIAAWPVNGFVEANDFTGKTVIPFCTSSSSGLGESGALLAQLAGSGRWLDGGRFRSAVAEEDVVAWVESLEF